MKYILLGCSFLLSLPVFAFSREQRLNCTDANNTEVVKMFYDSKTSPLGPVSFKINGKKISSYIMGIEKNKTVYTGKTASNEDYSFTTIGGEDEYKTDLILNGKVVPVNCKVKSKFRLFGESSEAKESSILEDTRNSGKEAPVSDPKNESKKAVHRQ